MTAIVEKVGILRTFKYISEIESNFANNNQPVENLFENFLNKVIKANIFTKAYVDKIIEEVDRKVEWASMNIQNSYNSPNFPLEKPFSHRVEQETKFKRQSNIEAIDLKKPVGLLSKLVVDSKTKKISNPMISKVLSDEKSPSPNSVQELIGTFKDSYELSELPVSSYSVSSDYLKDFSEDETQSRKFTENNMNDSRELRELDSARIRSKGSRRFSRTPTGMRLSDEERKQRLESRFKLDYDDGRKSLQLSRKSKGMFRSVTVKNEESENSGLSFLLEGGEDI